MAIRESVQITLPKLHRGTGKEYRARLDKKYGKGTKYSFGGQWAIVKRNARFTVLYAGRRWGKSNLAVAMLLKNALKKKSGWWVWPTQKKAKKAWEDLKIMCQDIPGAEIKETEKIISFGVGYIQIQSAHEKDSMRGPGVDLIIMDEVSFMRHGKYIWTSVLRHVVADKKGSVLFITSPNGFDWVYKLWLDAKDKKGWAAFRFPTWDAPHMDEEEIHDIFNDIGAVEFDQEVASISLAASNSVFGNVFDYTKAVAYEDRPDRGPQVAGVDLARHLDYFATSIVDPEFFEQTYLERWKGLRWDHSIEKCLNLLERFGVTVVVIDATGVGDVVAEQFEDAIDERGLDIEVIWFVFTAKSKTILIKDYALSLEKGKFFLLPDEDSIAEHNDFVGKKDQLTLRVKYEAQQGNDDLVIGGALSHVAMKQGIEGFVMVSN